MTKRKINVGDIVEIVNPVFIERCGYPKCVDDYLDEARTKYNKLDLKLGERRANRLIKQIAIELGYSEHFGGYERTLHTKTIDMHTGEQCRVLDIKHFVTGKCYSASGGYDSWTGEYDYESGYIHPRVVHTVLDVGCGLIEVTNVKMVQKCQETEGGSFRAMYICGT